MQEMMTFTSYLLEQIPDFLMSDAIKPLWAILLLAYIVSILRDLI